MSTVRCISGQNAGVSSTELRSQKRLVKMGLVGDTGIFEKYRQEAAFANGVEVVAAYTEDVSFKTER